MPPEASHFSLKMIAMGFFTTVEFMLCCVVLNCLSNVPMVSNVICICSASIQMYSVHVYYFFPAVPRTSEPFSYHYVFNFITRDIKAINISWPRVDVSNYMFVYYYNMYNICKDAYACIFVCIQGK